jgi:TolB-like protein/Tfp pilus assembly protein PilF
MRVVSRREVDHAKGKAADQGLAAQLGARYLLDGTVRAAGNSLRVSVNLTDTSTGTHMWAETYERSLSDGLFVLQDDIADRVIATVADSSGVLVRSMGAALKNRPWTELTTLELIIRFEAYVQRYRADEHAILRDGLEAAVERDPLDAEAWATLSAVVSHEHFFGFNPKPDTPGRTRRAADRAIEIDSACHRGWLLLACAHFIDRDLTGLRAAADRVIEINPLDTAKLAILAWLLVGAGDIERGVEVARQSMALHTNFAPWYRMPVFSARYIARDYQAALEEAKRVNIDTYRFAHLATACAAGQLGATIEAKAAIAALARIAGAPLEAARAREMWSLRFWDEGVVDHLMEGFEVACALAGAEPAGQPHTAASRPPSGPSTARARSGPTAASGVNRDYVVAIHPFTAHGSDEESTGLARGLTEDIGTALSRFQYFTVRASKDADARYAVEGSVRRSGNSIRVSARLIDTDTGASNWAENYDRTLGAASFFDLQDEITARLVSTVGSSSGPLVKAMASPLRERPVAKLSLHELVLRCTLYFGGMRIEEHALLRTAFEKALADQPSHALGWASLAGLYENEVSWGMNPLPDSMDRATRAARRSVETDPACQFGWSRLMGVSFHMNDLNGMRNAGDRILALNPLNQNTVGVAGVYFALRGDWDRGIPMVRRAIDLDPNHFGLLHSGLFLDHYRREEYEEALAQAKRINAFETATVALSVASAAGQLGRADEARAAFDALDRNHPKHKTVEAVRSHWAWFLRENELIDRLIEGFEKAQALVAVPASQAVVAKAPASGRTASIAVLPFTDMSAAKDQDWFCDGIAEEILNALSQLKGLRVAARGSAFSFKGKGEDLNSIGEKLNVGTILEGSVRRSGDRVRITAQLSDVKDGFQLWSERYDREMKDIFDVQDEIAKAIAARLKVTFSATADGRLVPKATENVEAYETYLRGRAMLFKRGKYIKEALEQFQNVVEMDPGYALAWAGIADVHSLMGYYGLVSPKDARPRALLAANRAIESDPGSAEAHASLAVVEVLYNGDLNASEREFKRALELNPRDTQARCWYAFFYLLWARGRFEAAVDEARNALDSDPLSSYAQSILGFCLLTGQRYDEALSVLRPAVLADPESFAARLSVGLCLSSAGRFEEAVSHFEEAVRMSSQSGYARGKLALALKGAGRFAEAKALCEQMKARAGAQYIGFINLAEAAFAAGDRTEAMALAQRAGDAREPEFLMYARYAPFYAWLREQPEWSAMLEQLDAPPNPES